MIEITLEKCARYGVHPCKVGSLCTAFNYFSTMEIII